MADIRPSTEIELELHDYIGSAYSPTVEVTETEDGHTVSITSRKASGIVTDEFDVKDGFDPVATVARGDHKAVLTVTDKFGTTTADIPDGVSPRVEITEDEDGHTVSITDAYGTHSYDVPDWSGDERERVEAEERRVAAEAARATAESQRVAAETQRASAETARQSAENARSAAEGARVQSESQRAENEAQRVAGEVQRGLNEQARVASETARETAWETMSADVLSATDDANEAAATAMGVSVSMLGNTAHTTITGTSAHASDAISFPPVGLSVHGASVQSGTPSTASPKTISHVTSATVRVTDGWSVPIDLDGNVLRSAGGAVDDIVELSYAGVGATEGTAVYDVTLHANVGTVTLNGTEEWSLSSLGLLRTTAISDLVRLPKSTTELVPLTCTQAVATSYADLRSTTGSIAIAESGNVFVNLPSIITVGAIRTWLSNHPMTVVYPLATPSDTSLGRVTLQSLPAPEFTMTVDGGAVQAPFDLSYVYDVSINEQERAEEWLSLKSDAVQATSDAGSAATSANAAATSASAAATNANATASSISAAAARGDYDGYSPTVAIADTELGHTVTITDRQGPHAYTVPTYADEEQARQDAWDQLSQDAQEAIDAATEAAESVSDDVDALYNGNLQLFGNQLTGELSGTIDTAADAFAAPPMALTVDGASTQVGTPTPDAPVPILSVENPVLCVAGKNLLPNNRFCAGNYNRPAGYVFNPATSAGGIVTDNWDGTFTMTAESGWAGASFYTDVIPAGTYRLKLAFSGATLRVSVGFVDAETMQFMTTTTNYTSSDAYDKTHTVSGPRIIVVSVASSSVGTVTITQPQLELGSTATAYEPYQGQTVSLYDGTLRSLPDGTKDELHLSYLRPSTRPGWAWYGREVTRSVIHTVYDGSETWTYEVTARGYRNFYSPKPDNTNKPTYGNHTRCSHGLPNSDTLYADLNGAYISSGGNTNLCFGDTLDISSKEDFKLWLAENPVTFDCPAATLVNTTLDPIELPELPAPNCTVWCDGGSAQPSFVMQYVQDTNIVIADLRAALADLATS